MVTNGITYGVSQYTSESVSYTRNGETKSVKEVLDDLIVKVDQKSGNFNIELAERTIGVSYTENTDIYETTIDNLLTSMINAMGSTAKTTELSTLKSATLTWTSENTGIVSISGKTVTGVKVGTTKLIGSATNGKQVIVPVNVIKGVYLADSEIAVGDYVAYDAGKWGAATDKPSIKGEFGGNDANVNKGNSVAYCGSKSANSTTLKGWRVLNVNKDTKTVTIVHAGQPECYYHGISTSDSMNRLDARAQSTYVNSAYAQSAHAMTKTEIENITDASDTLRKTGAEYWLAAQYSSTENYLVYVYKDGGIYGSSGGYSYGFRPVVVLKSTVLTTGKGPDQVGNKEAWQLVEMK